MKIVHVIDYFQPKIGYQEYFLAKEQQKLGHKVTVVTSDKYFPFPNYNETYLKILGGRNAGAGERTEERVFVKRLKSVEVVPGSLVILLGLFDALRSIDPDVVFCHNVYSITSFLASRYKSKIGYRLIYDTHAASFNTNLTDSFPKKIYNFLFHKMVVPFLKKKADKIFAIGNGERKFLADDFHIDKESIPIISLGVDLERFSFSVHSRQKIRNKLGLLSDDAVLIYAGKITSNKDIDILLRAMILLKAKTNIKLLIVGGGGRNYIDNLKNLVSKSKTIIWHDFMGNSELSDYYCAADIGIWPGDPSNAMLEAMACRLPLIIPQWDETKYLDSSKGVVRFQRGDVRNLANVIKKITENKGNIHKLSENAYKYAKNELSWTKIAQKSIDLVKKPHFYSIS